MHILGFWQLGVFSACEILVFRYICFAISTFEFDFIIYLCAWTNSVIGLCIKSFSCFFIFSNFFTFQKLHSSSWCFYIIVPQIGWGQKSFIKRGTAGIQSWELWWCKKLWGWRKHQDQKNICWGSSTYAEWGRISTVFWNLWHCFWCCNNVWSAD